MAISPVSHTVWNLLSSKKREEDEDEDKEGDDVDVGWIIMTEITK